MKLKITTKRAENLLANFNSTKENIGKLEKAIMERVDSKIREDRIIKASEITELKMYKCAVKKQLEMYTSGLATYIRSVSRQEENSRPPVEFIEQVRGVLEQAQELESDLDWNLKQIVINISISNMLLGCFDPVNLEEEPTSSPANDGEADPPTITQEPTSTIPKEPVEENLLNPVNSIG